MFSIIVIVQALLDGVGTHKDRIENPSYLAGGPAFRAFVSTFSV